jgi:hypothetical protein
VGRPGGVGGVGGVGDVGRPGGVGGVGGVPRYGAVGSAGLGQVARSNVVAGNSYTRNVNRAALVNQGAVVRNNFGAYNAFQGGWWGRYPGAWRAAAWGTGAAAAALWAAPAWGTVSSYCGYAAEPVYYDYGSNVVYEGDTVYVNGDSVGTQAQYAEQAVAIADTGKQAPAAKEDDWLPLGVFAMVQGEGTDGNDVFQLAVNKAGVIRGNYYNVLSDTTLPVYGSVDQKTQRAAWTVGDRKEPVYEVGFANLTKPETTMLVHFGKDRSQQWTLVRIEQPEGQQK